MANDPKSDAALNNIGMIKQAQGDLAGAQADYQQGAASSTPRTPRPLVTLPPSAPTRATGRAAANYASKALNIDSEFACRPTTIAAWPSSTSKNLASAIKETTTGRCEVDPNDEHAYNNRGLALLSRGDYDGAMSDFDMALQINPQFAQAQHNRSLARWHNWDVFGARPTISLIRTC